MGINGAMYNGVSGLNSFATAISVVSDNVANSNTTGYKSNAIHFGDMVNSYFSMNSNDTESEGSGSVVLGISTDYAQGLTQNTSNWADLCISGEGFFSVQDAANRTYYSRDGSFHLDEDGDLVNLQGLTVQSLAGPINIDPTAGYVSYRVDSQGYLYGTNSAGVETAKGDLPQILLTTFSNKDGLQRQGNNLYLKGPAVGQVFTNDPAAGNPEMFGNVVDYSLESSNVDLAMEMVNMIIYQASYNANSKTITTCKDMIDTTVNMVR